MENLPILATLTSIFGFIFFTKRKFKIPPSILPILIYSLTILLSFFLIFLNFFNLFKILFCIFGNILFIPEIILSIKKHKTFKKYLKNYRLEYFFIFLCFSTLIWINGTKIYGWDEFFWGQFAKHINAFGTFWTQKSAILATHAAYPPGNAIAQNIFMPFGKFNETSIYFANIFPFLCLIPILVNYVYENKKVFKIKTLKILIILLLGFFIYFYFGFNHHIPNYGYTDHTLGIVFTIGLLVAFDIPKKTNILYLLPVISLLTILKSSGIILAATVALTKYIRLAVDSILKKRKNGKTKKSIATVFILLIIAFIPCLVWNIYIKKENLINKNISNINFKTIKNAFITKDSERYKKTWNNFYVYSISKPLNYTEYPLNSILDHGNLAVWTTIYLILFFITIILSIKKRKKIIKDLISYIVLFGGLICWVLFHLLIWLVVFSEYEGPILASYERYLSTFLMGTIILLVTTLIKEIKTNKAIMLISLFTFLITISFSTLFIQLFKKPKNNYDHKRDEITALANNIKKTVTNYSNIYYINQDSNGYEAMIFRYEMSPNNYVQSWSWSLGDKYRDEDIWTTSMTVEELKSVLSNYNYIVLDKIDENFIKKYDSIFQPTLTNNLSKLWKISQDNGLILIQIK